MERKRESVCEIMSSWNLLKSSKNCCNAFAKVEECCTLFDH